VVYDDCDDDYTPRSRELKWLKVCRFAAREFSTCAKRQYFAVVLSPEGRIAGTGYNGSPPGIPHCADGYCPRMQEGSEPGSAYDNCIALHAEENALLWSDRTDRQGGTIIVNGPPCWACGKKIAGSGVSRLVYMSDPSYADWPRVEALLSTAGVTCVGVDAEFAAL
jgi:dCMP deaminase